MKIYGKDKTHLTLCKPAQWLYNNTDPIEIREYENDDEHIPYLYEIRGAYEVKNLSEEDLDAFLAQCADDAVEHLIEENAFTVESFGSNLPDTWEKDLDLLNHELRDRLSRMDYYSQPGPYPIRDITEAIWEDYCSGALTPVDEDDLPF